MAALGPAIDQARVREDISPDGIEGLERLRAVLAFAGKRLAIADPLLVHTSPLDSLASYVQSATTEVQAFVSNGAVGHIANANGHADAALLSLAQILPPQVPEELETLQTSVINYRNTLEDQLRRFSAETLRLRSEADSLQDKLGDLAAQIGSESQRLSQLSAEYQSQFSSAQDTRSREFAGAQATRQERATALITEFSERLTEHNADFAQRKELASQDYETRLDALRQQFEVQAANVLDQIKRHQREVEKLVGVIGNLGVTSGYLKAANFARRSAWFWQGMTVLSMLGFIGFAYYAFIPSLQGNVTWQALVARALVTLTVGVLAAYSANQADKYIEIERRNRKMALELDAIGPYLAPLPQEKQDEFRISLGDRSFGREESSVGRRLEKSPATVIDVMMKSKAFREFITDIVKAARG